MAADTSIADKLPPRIRAFVDEYVSGAISATQAAINVGYSARTAGVQAYKLLKRPDAQQYERIMRAELAQKSSSLSDQVIAEMTAMAMFNVEDVSRVDSDGNLEIDFSNATRDHYKAVTKIKNKTRQVRNARGEVIATEKEVEIGLADKYRGLELLAKHLGLLKEPDQKIVVDVADRLLNARARLAGKRDTDIVIDQ